MARIERGEPAAIIGICKSVENEYKRDTNRSMIKIKVEDEVTGKVLHINCFGMYYMLNYYLSCVDQRVIVGGKINFNEDYQSFSMLNPVVFSQQVEKNQRIIPVYRKHKGISEEAYETLVKTAISFNLQDYAPQSAIRHYGLPDFNTTIRTIHHPLTRGSITKAKQRVIFDSMLYFACKLEEQRRNINQHTQYYFLENKKQREMLNNLPYKLTDSQWEAISDMTNLAHRGQRISALVQGDVGSGKTIVAFAMMFSAAEEGYQSVLMAPTAVLAKQHYQALSELAKPYGFKVVYLGGDLKPKQKGLVLSQIANGEALMIVGTHACIAKSVEYKDLALAVTDEEHKFGVTQREMFANRSEQGMHYITMSGTPIPRTLADTLYGSTMKVYTLKMPSERKPVQTAVCQNNQKIFEWMEKEIRAGHQCYVVCPLINEADDDTAVAGVSSIEEMEKTYSGYFEPKGIEIAVITGKTKKEDQEAIIEDFVENRTKILMATTIIEVGVNNPNATVMVITGAERLGLASLHQLRGRVGRGEAQSYCILQRSENAQSGANLDVLVRENNGFKIAQEDMKNRGTGDLFGTEQSGDNDFINLMFQYPNMFAKIKDYVRTWLNADIKKYIVEYENRFMKE